MGKYFDTLSSLLKDEKLYNYSQYKLMKCFDISQNTAKKVKGDYLMKVKQAKLLKKMRDEIEVSDYRLMPIILYLLKDLNYFRPIQEIEDESNWTRYMIKKAKDIIDDYIKENMDK